MARAAFLFETPDAKRNVSTFLGALGTLLVPIAFGLGDAWTMAVALSGSVCMVLSVLVGHAAASQEAVEARASDLIEWKREEQRFRTVLRRLWPALKSAYSHYSVAHNLEEQDLQALVDRAGWPGEKDEDQALSKFVSRCMSSEWDFPRVSSHAVQLIAEHLGKDGTDLQLDIAELHDLIEIWAIALDVGGGRAAALEEVLVGAGEGHDSTMRLLYYLSVAFVDHRGAHKKPDFGALDRVRDVMLGG
jgi:hypothetical protein